MWLLNTSTYQLENTPHPPRYAILSHTWHEEEVSFQQIQDLEVAKTMKGWRKIEKTCQLAAASDIDHAWIDTCCIDKSSSAELSEAINSMFRWYKDSLVCYIWLSDFQCSVQTSPRYEFFRGVSQCRWFYRGWTLQELIAPQNMIFYNSDWVVQGTKTDMVAALAKVTSIDEAVLTHEEDLSTVPVARRMAWAQGRETTRVEDMAYSLLGIFDVNMPMIYGEGEKAFLRLQEAIALGTDDLSLFAWSDGSPTHSHRPQGSKWHGIFASCPCRFASCINLVNIQNPLYYHARAFTIANQRVEFSACLGMDRTIGGYIMGLHCEYRRASSPKGRRAALQLMKTPHGFARYTTRLFEFTFGGWESLDVVRWDTFPRPVNIPKHISFAESERMPSQFRNAFRFWIKSPRNWNCEVRINDPEVPNAQFDGRFPDPPFWDPCRMALLTENHHQFVGLLYICVSYKPFPPSRDLKLGRVHTPVLLFCGFFPSHESHSTEYEPWVHLQRQRDWNRALLKPFHIFEWDIGEKAAKRHEMHYSRFLAPIGNSLRENIQFSSSRYPNDFNPRSSKVEISEHSLCLTASLSAVGSGDRLTNDITIVLEVDGPTDDENPFDSNTPLLQPYLLPESYPQLFPNL